MSTKGKVAQQPFGHLSDAVGSSISSGWALCVALPLPTPNPLQPPPPLVTHHQHHHPNHHHHTTTPPPPPPSLTTSSPSLRIIIGKIAIIFSFHVTVTVAKCISFKSSDVSDIITTVAIIASISPSSSPFHNILSIIGHCHDHQAWTGSGPNSSRTLDLEVHDLHPVSVPGRIWLVGSLYA